MAKQYFAKVVGNTVVQVLVGSAPPDYEEVASDVSVGHVRDGNGGFEKPGLTITQQRAAASLEKVEFCIKFNEMGVLPDDELIEGASGGFPKTFADAISGLPIADQARIRGQWARKTHIDRTSSTLAFVAGLMSVSDSQLDEAFGVSVN